MKTSINIELKYEQVLSLVKQLSRPQMIRLSRELEKEFVDLRLTKLLKTFRTNQLDLKTITEEAEAVRSEVYEKQKR